MQLSMWLEKGYLGWGVLVFWVYAGEVFGREAIVDVLAELFCREVVCLKLVNVIYCFV